MTVIFVLAALLAVDAILHGAIVARFGLKGNEPPLIFGLAYAVLAVINLLQVPYAPWAALVVTVIGTAALVAQFGKIQHDKTIEKVILVVNALIIVFFLINLLR